MSLICFFHISLTLDKQIQKMPARAPTKRSAPINFVFVRHSELQILIGNVVFSLVRFVASLIPSPFSPDPKLETEKNFCPRPRKMCDRKLIGAICYLASPTTKSVINAGAIDYQFVSQNRFFAEHVLLCYRELSNISLRSHHNGNFNKYRVSGHEICFSSFQSFHSIGSHDGNK